ncbi:hypothetical protein EUX98_g8557 [Antrodiella citrinella]|uniref:Pentatricopeptide repeat-containing protein-mitochondrial domain-containing protein n=1 Tax=Antrodiella citrinella TaxID=2447956 RepID=A0A4S4MC03_9APHY|nr:hypothetical protein EUX98_g8557 [Antrodiella citrinella]
MSQLFDTEEAWSVYQDFRGEQVELTSEVAEDLLQFSAKMLSAITHTPPDHWRKWSIRIKPLVQDLEPLVDEHRWACLMVRILALTGSFQEALEKLDVIRKADVNTSAEIWLIEAYQSLMTTVDHYHTSTAVFELITQRWGDIGNYLVWRGHAGFYRDVRPYQQTLRNIAYRIMSTIEDPVKTYVALSANWSVEQRTRAGEYVVEVLCRHRDHADDAFSIMKYMFDQGLQPSIYHRTLLIKAISKADKTELSIRLFVDLHQGLEDPPPSVLSCGLYVFARAKDLERSETFFTKLQRLGVLTDGDVGMMLHCHAVNGHYERAEEFFQEYCVGPSDHVVFAPNIIHYTSVLLAYAEGRNFDGMDNWLKKMVDAGFKPDDHVYNIVLESMIRRGNTEEMLAVVQRMRAAGFPPTRVAYTTLMVYTTSQRDPEMTDAIYKQAMSEGIQPDRHMLNTLLNAHVESGSWRGAILAFDYIKNSKFRFGLDVWTTLLKAYVIIGAPFRVVSTLFTKLDEVGVQPDDRAYALIIQSACDSGRIGTALHIFNEMEKLSQEWPTDIHVNGFVLTIIMAYYLRVKDKLRAKAILDEIRNRNIDPTSTTYAIILNAYGNEKTVEHIEQAEDFLSGLLEEEEKMNGWLAGDGGRAKALETVFMPVLSAWSRHARADEVKRAFQTMLDKGGKPTLGSLTTLLDAYRRQRNVAAVKELWPRIVELGEQYSSQLDPLLDTVSGIEPPPGRRHSNVLCIPFSILVDALSAAGFHEEIAAAWADLQSKGFTLDSHNWNHLAIALVRAGEPERAFEIVDRVILKHRRDTIVTSPRDTNPLSPLLSELREEFLETRDLPHHETPLGRTRERAALAGLIGKKVQPWMTDLSSSDFAHPLHILHHVSPGWNIWRPHNQTLYLLGRALHHMHNGKPIQPIRPGEDYDAVNLRSQPTSMEELEARREEARASLSRIYDNFPEAAATVLDFERWQQSRTKRKNYRTSNHYIKR